MKVAGFSFIKDAQIFDYPVVEAIQSILPLCDRVYVAVGKSNDDTRELIQQIHPSKIEILDTVWNESLREGGAVLANETNKIFQHIPIDYDWCFYIQGDEVLHEKYHAPVLHAMHQYLLEPNIDALLFHYKHFYGSYDYTAEASNFYKKEIRIVRNNKQIFSYQDAQGFRMNPNTKLKAVLLPAYIYHYGWVKQPKAMQAKQLNFNKYWHNDEWIEEHVAKVEEFDYTNIKTIGKFSGTHPAVMQTRIAKLNWKFDYDLSRSKVSLKDKFKRVVHKLFGIDLNYKNYILLKEDNRL